MTPYLIYLALLVPASGGAPLTLPHERVVASFRSDSDCETFGAKLAAEVQRGLQAKYRATYRCERLTPAAQ